MAWRRASFGNSPTQVEEMALQNITLRRSDGVRIFYPIVKMCGEPIYNVTRSANRWEGFKARRAPLPA
jgi:small-conductance mechanosensitive channel